MKCPICSIQNPEGATRCSSCKGVLSDSGVNYSCLSPDVDWQDCGPQSHEDELAAESAAAYYPITIMRLLMYLVLTGVLSSSFLLSGYVDGNNQSTFVGLVMLAAFTLCLWMLWREIRSAYSEEDLELEPLSVQDMDKEVFDLTSLPPRR